MLDFSPLKLPSILCPSCSPFGSLVYRSPFFLNPFPSLWTFSSVLLTICSLFWVLYKQSSHGCWLSADRLTCEYTRKGKSRMTAMKETLINTLIIPWLKKIPPENYLFVSTVSFFPSWFFPSLSLRYREGIWASPAFPSLPTLGQEERKGDTFIFLSQQYDFIFKYSLCAKLLAAFWLVYYVFLCPFPL